MEPDTINLFRGAYFFLSNFYETPVQYEGLCYQSAEAAYQAAKCRNPGDRRKFCWMKPADAKKEGYRVLLREDWEEKKLDVMYQIVKTKFDTNPVIKNLLLKTKNALIQEGNTWGDTYWGVCGGKGENHLGKILMKLREEYREQGNKKEKDYMKIKKIDKNAVVPVYANSHAAGADLYACMEKDTIIEPGKVKLIHTGIAMEIPEGYAGLIYARSGLALKKGLAPANKVGVIDPDYRGEIMVALYNHSGIPQTISPGERIAQMVFTPFIRMEMEEAEELNQTSRGTGGFGSTGTN